MNIEPEQIREKPFFNIVHLRFLFFSYKGRVNRKRYLLSGLLLTPICLFAGFVPDSYGIIALVFAIFGGYMGLMVSIKRAHDRNRSGHFCWLFLVPILSLWPAIELMFFKGTSGANRFGADMLPPRNGPEHTAERAEEHSFSRAGPEVKGAGYLGIYLSKDTATVVCVGPQGRDANVLGCFSVSVEEHEEQNPQALARLIAEGCAERGLKFSEAAVALDCAMFMQHNVRSQFKEAKQIAATVRFDTEEALSTDITDVAIAFKIASSDRTGSELTVFTAEQKILSDILLFLQNNNIDPTNVEPDINCLSRFILQNVSSPQNSHSLFGILSRHSGYFLAFAKSQETPAVRTLLVDPTQNRGDLLAREVPLTTALAGIGEPINCLKIFDSADSVNYQQLSEKLGIQASGVDLVKSVAADAAILADCAGPVDFAIAYGAALAHLDKADNVNFRNDFMPYQGKKVQLQKTLKFLSISVSILVLALGMYVTSQLWRTNKDRRQIRKKFKPDYLAVMLGEKQMPAKSSEVVRKLKSELMRTQKTIIGGIGSPVGEGQESVSAKLALVLGAFNKCAAQTKLQIKEIFVTAKEIRIVGDTSNSKRTRQLRNAIEKNNLKVVRDRVGSKGVRHNFTITIVPKE